MVRQPLPPLAAVVSFIAYINRADLDGLTSLMSEEHRLVVLDEKPLVGRAENRNAWAGYFSSFPEYVIHPRFMVAEGASVAVLGATTGSHLGLRDEDELKLTVIWLADVADGALTSWVVCEDTPALRANVGIPAVA